MSSKVQICNMALSRLGANTITALSDNTTEAKLCTTLYDDLADRVMMQGSWTSTIYRVALAQTTNTPAYGYAYEYQLPIDPLCLKVLEVNESAPGSIDHQIEQDKLLTDSASIKIKYIGRLVDTESYGPMLAETIEVLLASYLAFPITGDRGMAQGLREEYAALIGNNLAIDGQQGSNQVISATDLIDVR